MLLQGRLVGCSTLYLDLVNSFCTRTILGFRFFINNENKKIYSLSFHHLEVHMGT